MRFEIKLGHIRLNFVSQNGQIIENASKEVLIRRKTQIVENASEEV
jgi:hypothetical protein